MRPVSMQGVSTMLVRGAKRKYVVTKHSVIIGYLYAAGNGWQATPLGGTTTTHLTEQQATFQLLAAFNTPTP